jgi:Na+/proline symporter
MVAFLGIFGWGLFASALVPSLAVGLNWDGATREGAIASICTGLFVTLALETAAYFKVFTFPSGVTASAVALVLSFLAFFFVSWLTSRDPEKSIDPDVRLIMEL